VEIPLPSVEIPFLDTSTKRSLNLAPFDKISKSGDGGGSGGCLGTKRIPVDILL
jgi:hypothetical protein